MSSPLRVLLPGFRGTTLPPWLRARLESGLAGVCLFGDNLVDDDQAAALTAQIRAANPDAVIAVDEEGGDVTRLAARTGSPYPGNGVLGRLDDVQLTARIARAVARRLAAAGITLFGAVLLAPLVAMATDPPASPPTETSDPHAAHGTAHPAHAARGRHRRNDQTPVPPVGPVALPAG